MVALRGAGVRRGNNCPGAAVPMLDESLITAVVVEADGPAVRCRTTRHAMEFVVLVGAGVGRGNNCPGGSVPMLDHCLVDASTGRRIVVADRPAVRPRSAGHASQEAATAGVGRGEDRPASSPRWRRRLAWGACARAANGGIALRRSRCCEAEHR